MKKLLVILILITCTLAMQGCFIQFPLFLDYPRIDIKDDTLTYDGKVYVFLEDYRFQHYGFSLITQVGWTHGPYFHKMGVYTFDDDLEKNFIRVEGSTPRIGVNKEYNMIPVFECHIDKIWGPGNSIGYKGIEVIGMNQLINFETSIEETSSFNNSYQYTVYVRLFEYPFLSYMFSIFLVDGQYIMDVLDRHANQTFYPIQAEYYYLFTK